MLKKARNTANANTITTHLPGHLHLPETVDHSKIEAEYTDGILKLNVAKKEEAKFQSREIAVK